MRRSSEQQLPAKLADQAGFTLVELLVTMLIAIVVLAGGTYGVALAFQQSNSVAARVNSTQESQVGLQTLMRDVRQAVTCPATTYDSASSGNIVSGPRLLVSGSMTTLELCDPAPGAQAQSGTLYVPQTALVTWTCNIGSTTTETCQRAWASLSASSPYRPGTFNASTAFHGVLSLAFSGVIGSASAGRQTLTAGQYTLTAGQSNSISWLGITASLAQLRSPGDPTSTTSLSAPIAIQTGAALENFGS